MSRSLELPGYLELPDGSFVDSQHATVAEWKASRKVETNRKRYRQISKMVRFASAVGLGEDARLLPYLDFRSKCTEMCR
jgi:hypothetical protein